ncbi:stress up-regulated Nod 19 protein [Medicago truncatula]|uniref:Stress up-regulated Nod 19 protein n=1 Tax=Medicago truncatula TaxID=3880 RepID=G7J0F3_MEDTR|nr:stress up-regulated Nod 19 protein [Medicago truncatula]
MSLDVLLILMIFGNNGSFNGDILPHYWGLGSESRGTISKLPDPFALEVGNPVNITKA